MKIKVTYLPEVHLPPDSYFEPNQKPLKVEIEHNKADGLWHIAAKDVQGNVVVSILSVRCASYGMYMRWLETHVKHIELNGDVAWKNPILRKES